MFQFLMTKISNFRIVSTCSIGHVLHMKRSLLQYFILKTTVFCSYSSPFMSNMFDMPKKVCAHCSPQQPPLLVPVFGNDVSAWFKTLSTKLSRAQAPLLIHPPQPMPTKMVRLHWSLGFSWPVITVTDSWTGRAHIVTRLTTVGAFIKMIKTRYVPPGLSLTTPLTNPKIRRNPSL